MGKTFALLSLLFFAAGCAKPADVTSPTVRSSGPTRETVRHVLDLEQGTRQSPITILTAAAQATTQHSILFDYGKSSERVVNKGHTIEVDYDAGSSLRFDGRTYLFKQFHFHTPSEHIVDREQFPMEMHMVHTCPVDPNRFLVIAVLFREGKRDPFLDEFMAAIPKQAGTETRSSKVDVDIRDVFGQRDHYFVYEGSLTTPPYTEHVHWLVRAASREASRDQLAAFHTLEGDNARHVQPGQARTVQYQ